MRGLGALSITYTNCPKCIVASFYCFGVMPESKRYLMRCYNCRFTGRGYSFLGAKLLLVKTIRESNNNIVDDPKEPIDAEV